MSGLSPRRNVVRALATFATLAALTVIGAGAAFASLPDGLDPVQPESEPEARKPTLVEARALLAQARTAYRDKRYPETVTLVDESMVILRQLMVLGHARNMRVAAGEVFRSCASLRLSASKRLDRVRDAGPPIGPFLEADGEPEDENTTLADALLPMAMTPTTIGSDETIAGDPDLTDDEDRVEYASDHLPALAGAAFPLPSRAEDAPDWTEPQMAAPEETEAPGPNSDPASIRLRQNARVDKWIQYYTGHGRRHYERYLARSGRYDEWMRSILRDEGLPEEIVNLVFVESGFNTEAVSRSYAVGQWQFIRGTARLFDLRMNTYVDDRKDPELATRAAARYLKHLYALFHDWDLALASYNCGEGRTIRTIAKTGKWDYWALRLPREAMHYVPKYMACLALARDPARYGMDKVEKETPMAFDTIQMPGAFDAKALATACGITFDSLRTYNPSYRKTVTIPRNGVSTVRVPKGHGETLLASIQGGELELPQVAVSPQSELMRHRVRRGETLGGISRRYRVPMREIASLNHIRVNSTLQIGQRLLIPERGVTVASSRRSSSGGTSSATYSSVKSIRIQKGDTLSALAERYQTDVRTLRALNGLRARQHIKAGGVLKVPVR
jgi:membrane-bound lytic murein transglycosylase D